LCIKCLPAVYQNTVCGRIACELLLKNFGDKTNRNHHDWSFNEIWSKLIYNMWKCNKYSTSMCIFIVEKPLKILTGPEKWVSGRVICVCIVFLFICGERSCQKHHSIHALCMMWPLLFFGIHSPWLYSSNKYKYYKQLRPDWALCSSDLMLEPLNH
jgi:hypothetical protein